MSSSNPPGCTDACFPDRYAPTAWVERDRAARVHAEHPAPCPECKAGKHGNCDMTTWDTRTDDRTSCPCYMATPQDHSGGNPPGEGARSLMGGSSDLRFRAWRTPST